MTIQVKKINLRLQNSTQETHNKLTNAFTVDIHSIDCYCNIAENGQNFHGIQGSQRICHSFWN